MRNKYTGNIRATASALALALALTAAPAWAEDTIKIGALLIDSGPLAGLKDSQTKAINLSIELVNAAGGAAGKKLEADFISYPGSPDTAVDGATRMARCSSPAWTHRRSRPPCRRSSARSTLSWSRCSPRRIR